MPSSPPPAPPRAEPDRVPRTFRRESRLFLSVALLLILFLNFVTLFFFRNAVQWGQLVTERRAAELLRRVAVPSDASAGDTIERAVLEPDVLFVGVYDVRGRRVQGAGHGLDAPPVLTAERPSGSRVAYEWKRRPPILLARMAAGERTFLVALDPGRERRSPVSRA